jgi:hypothetical protein
VNLFRQDIPPHVAEVICSFHPDLKRLIKSAMWLLVASVE